jgi:hypothetical protein
MGVNVSAEVIKEICSEENDLLTVSLAPEQPNIKRIINTER